ncbi:hypothetical protein H2204_015027 [Knufia peltigerae]|uniref:AB hydrolase-1 domain-containing protein n=1 Tax=Knufia peltigerae TaxID=1002370 RepID=A0AA38XFS3_9EURO|nr:hypothetical protein H2204_015027 [Knufia peltigerae]
MADKVMLQLSSDPSFHYELLRVLAATATQGSDVTEVLQVCNEIIPGDFESWYSAFKNLADRVLKSAQESPRRSQFDGVTLRNMYFRASHYYFAADFYLHGDEEDPRTADNYQHWTRLFDQAIALLPTPGERLNLSADGFKVPIVLLRPGLTPNDNRPRPTIILGNGFDGSMEEMIHVLGLPALERGYNVVLYEGPGQTGVRRVQNLRFIHDWERVVNPILDFLSQQPFVDVKRISLVGYSLGGYLAARAAAFEPRLAAVVLIDGVWDYGSTLKDFFPDTMQAFLEEDAERCNHTFKVEAQKSTSSRWAYEHFLWSFNNSAYEGLKLAQKMKIGGFVDKIKCAVFVGEARDDQFFQEQPKKVSDALGRGAYFFSPPRETGATTHCHVGATFYLAQEVFAWLQDKSLD